MAKISIKKLEELIHNGDLDTIIVASPDMQGRLFGKRCSAKYFMEEAREKIHTCTVNFIWDITQDLGENYPFSNWDTGFPDLKAIPDLNTLRIYPWFPRTAFIMADLYYEDGREVSIAPRNILKKQLEKASNMGFQVNMASELEFYLMKETSSSAMEKGFKDLTPFSPHNADYSIYRSSCDEWFLGEVRRKLNEAGLDVECTKAEWGEGQAELNLRYAEALEMADRTAIFKNGMREMAYQHDVIATFMAKPDTEPTGSSFHLHASLWDGQGKNIFDDSNGEYGMSEVCRFFLGGMMELAPELMCFYGPTINSYKRYGATAGAPDTMSWGFDNRTLSFRIVGDGNSKRIENRIPGADGNPYLVLAATLASGLYGIENKITPPGPPTLKNASADESLRRLPMHLHEAVDLFSESQAAKTLFGKEVIEHYSIAARNEVESFRNWVTDWEKKRYLEQI